MTDSHELGRGNRPSLRTTSAKRSRPTRDNRSKSFRFQWASGQKLPTGVARDLVPSDFFETWHAKEMDAALDQDKAAEEQAKREGKPFNPIGWISGRSIRGASPPKSTWMWLLAKGVSRFLIFFFGGLIIAAQLLVYLFVEDVDPALVFWQATVPALLLNCLVFGAIWALVGFLEKFFPQLIYKAPKGPLWEFNRESGLVTLFKNPKKKKDAGKIEWQSPFSEFDGYVHMGPTVQGLPMYYLVMVHRYKEQAMRLNQFLPASPNDEKHKALWNFWQQYMDKTVPLPDIPLFEPERPKDAASAEEDRITRRPPRYWRDMDEQSYKQKTKDMFQRCLKVFG